MKKIVSIILLIVIMIGGFYLLFSYSSNQLNAQNLISAIEKNDIDKLEKLLKKRGDIDAKPNVVCIDCTNFPPLHMACNLGNFEAVKLLVENGANVNNVNATNNTSPLLAALRTHNSNGLEIAKYLIDKGADIFYRNLQGYTPANASLHLNTNPYNVDEAKAQYDFVVWLIDKGVDVENSGTCGNLIFDAAATNNVLVVEYLVDNNLADINLQNSSGYTSLMFASMTNSKETVEYLLQNGANKELKNKYGEIALDKAIERNNQEIVSLLNN